MPLRIGRNEREPRLFAQRALEIRLADPAFYREPADVVRDAVTRLDTQQTALQAAYARWDALETKRAEQ